MKSLILIPFLIVSIPKASGQDTHFSQPMAACLYMNPAFAGTAQNARISSAYLFDGWDPAPVNASYYISYDQQIMNLGGLGALAKYEYDNFWGRSTLMVGGAYSRYFRITNTGFLRAGIKGSYNSRTVDFSKVKLGSYDASRKFSETYGDCGAGVLFYGEDFYTGLSTDHLFEPAATTDSSGISERVYRKYRLQGGYFQKLTSTSNSWIINPYIVAEKQGNFKALQPGVNVHKGLFATGISYTVTSRYYDALNFLAGFQKGRIKVGYSMNFYTHHILYYGSPHLLSITCFLGKPSNAPGDHLAGKEMFQKMY